MGLDRLVQAFNFQENYEEHVRHAAIVVGQHFPYICEHPPVFGLTLGSGLGDLTKSMESVQSIPFSRIPHWPVPRATGHEGLLVYGTLSDIPVLALKGRTHYYDVADEPLNTGILQVVFGVHVLAELGVQHYFVTNSAGGLNPAYRVGDVMVLRSHMTNIPNPLLGRVHNFKRVHTQDTIRRFEPLYDAYDKKLSHDLVTAGAPFADHVHQGTYFGATGQTYETPAECQALRAVGVDAVGMSSVPEVIAARSRGMNVVGFSLLSTGVAPSGGRA